MKKRTITKSAGFIIAVILALIPESYVGLSIQVKAAEETPKSEILNSFEGNGVTVYNETDEENVELPAKFDLRDKGYVTPVKNQGRVNSCWSFAIISSVETNILYKLGLSYEEYEKIWGAA